MFPPSDGFSHIPDAADHHGVQCQRWQERTILGQGAALVRWPGVLGPHNLALRCALRFITQLVIPITTHCTSKSVQNGTIGYPNYCDYVHELNFIAGEDRYWPDFLLWFIQSKRRSVVVIELIIMWSVDSLHDKAIPILTVNNLNMDTLEEANYLGHACASRSCRMSSEAQGMFDFAVFWVSLWLKTLHDSYTFQVWDSFLNGFIHNSFFTTRHPRKPWERFCLRLKL